MSISILLLLLLFRRVLCSHVQVGDNLTCVPIPIFRRRIATEYFGTSDGVYGIYPATARALCDDYDPRFRPWYVAAQTVAKHVLIILDISGSMLSDNRSTVAVEAALTVLDTLNPDDLVNVIKFNGAAQGVEGFSACFRQGRSRLRALSYCRVAVFIRSLTLARFTTWCN
jgi:hypothetical protein